MSFVSPAQHRGVTLIELMIVVAVIAILGTVAYPSYMSYVQRGYIGGATSQLSQLAYLLEQYFQDNKTYSSQTASCGSATGSVYVTAGSSYPSATNFTFSCTNSVTAGGGVSTGSDKFTISAQGTGPMSQYGFSIDSLGNRYTTAFPGYPTAGTLPRACWMLKAGDC